MLDGASPALNIAEYVEIFGTIDPELFERALRQVVAATETLHLRITDTGDGPRQYLAPDPDWELPFIDVSCEPDPRGAAEAWMHADMLRVMDPRRHRLF